MAQPLQLTAADSGTAGHDLVITAAPGEHPILSGAGRIEHWQLADPARHLWSAPVPASVANTRQLYVDGWRATRTRGRLPVALTMTPTGYTAVSDTMAAWKNPSDLEFVYTGGNASGRERSEGWARGLSLAARLRPSRARHHHGAALLGQLHQARDAAQRRAHRKPCGPHERWQAARRMLKTPSNCWARRDSSTLTAPRTFYYVPRAGEDLTKADVELPVLETLLDAERHRRCARRITSSSPACSSLMPRGSDPAAPMASPRFRPTIRSPGPTATRARRLCTLVPGGSLPLWRVDSGSRQTSPYDSAHHIQFVRDAFVHLGAAGLSTRRRRAKRCGGRLRLLRYLRQRRGTGRRGQASGAGRRFHQRQSHRQQPSFERRRGVSRRHRHRDRLRAPHLNRAQPDRSHSLRRHLHGLGWLARQNSNRPARPTTRAQRRSPTT